VFNSSHFDDLEDLDPIDIAESLAVTNEWEYERLSEDQISMVVTGLWREYSITLAWSAIDETFRLILAFEFTPRGERILELYKLLNLANDQCWSGNFIYWPTQCYMMYRYGLVMATGQLPEPDQISRLINAAVASTERFYPAFQLVSWGGKTADEAIRIALMEPYGRA
jgi:hypothetical protein